VRLALEEILRIATEGLHFGAPHPQPRLEQIRAAAIGVLRRYPA
jgi:hypothetical protein